MTDSTPYEDWSDEKIEWQSKPSQVLAFNHWLVGIFLSALLIANGAVILAELHHFLGGEPLSSAWLLLGLTPVLPAIYKSLEIACTVFRITSQRLKVRSGILSKRTDEIELHRIRDYVVLEPFALRVFGLGIVRVKSVDRTTPVLDLKGVRGPDAVRNTLRTAVYARQREVGWSEHEVT